MIPVQFVVALQSAHTFLACCNAEVEFSFLIFAAVCIVLRPQTTIAKIFPLVPQQSVGQNSWAFQKAKSLWHPPPTLRLCVTQRFRPWEEEATHMSHRRLRQSLRQDVPPSGPPALAQWWAALRLQLDVLREALHTERRAAKTPADAHRWGHTRTQPIRHTGG